MNNQTLPEFPDFAALGPHHQTAIKDLVGNHAPYSDYNFVSLWSWDHERKLRLSTLNGNLVIRFQDYSDPTDFFYSFIGINHADKTASSLLKQSQQEGKSELRLIPETVIKSFKDPGQFFISEDRDSFDYIIATTPEPESEQHKPKRREVHRFMKEYGHQVTVSEMDLNDPKSSEDILKVFEDWQADIGTDSRFNAGELAALKKLLAEKHSIDTSNLHVVGLYMSGELSAFCISEVLAEGYAMGHYAKTNRKYRRAGAALDHFTHETLAAKGVKFLNYEQDLGLEGLRNSKLSKQPVFFLKKYKVGFK